MGGHPSGRETVYAHACSPPLTPEGEALEKSCGLQRIGQQYGFWALLLAEVVSAALVLSMLWVAMPVYYGSTLKPGR